MFCGQYIKEPMAYTINPTWEERTPEDTWASTDQGVVFHPEKLLESMETYRTSKYILKSRTREARGNKSSLN